MWQMKKVQFLDRRRARPLFLCYLSFAARPSFRLLNYHHYYMYNVYVDSMLNEWIKSCALCVGLFLALGFTFNLHNRCSNIFRFLFKCISIYFTYYNFLIRQFDSNELFICIQVVDLQDFSHHFVRDARGMGGGESERRIQSYSHYIQNTKSFSVSHSHRFSSNNNILTNFPSI